MLPFTVSPDGKLHFLLGREREGWSEGGCWSGFEGRAVVGETDVEAAAREFFEETLGTCDAGPVVQRLRDRDYALRVVVGEGTRRVHVTYALQVPWGDAKGKFAKRRETLLKLVRMGREMRLLAANAPSGYPFLLEGCAHAGENVRAVSCEHWCPKRAVVRHVLVSGRELLTEVGHLEENRAVHRLAHWLRIREEATRLASGVGFALLATYKAGAMRTLRVREEFLEKTEVRLWPASELRREAVEATQLRSQFAVVLREILITFAA